MKQLVSSMLMFFLLIYKVRIQIRHLFNTPNI